MDSPRWSKSDAKADSASPSSYSPKATGGSGSKAAAAEDEMALTEALLADLEPCIAQEKTLSREDRDRKLVVQVCQYFFDGKLKLPLY